jgi:hypothetical protein
VGFWCWRRGDTPDPSTVLAAIWNGTGYGSFDYSYIADIVNPMGAVTAWINAQTTPAGLTGYSGGLPTYAYATIKMNTNASTPLNVSSSAQDWGMTILHELGHVFQFLFGQNSTQIKYDGEGAPAGASAVNTALVRAKCF